jgi:hypothetical protein
MLIHSPPAGKHRVMSGRLFSLFTLHSSLFTQVRSTPFLALALFLFVPSGYAACEYREVASAAYRSSILDVAADGPVLWAADNYGVALFDRSVDPPARIGSLALPGATVRVRVDGPVTYAASGSSVYVLQRNGRAIEVLTSLNIGSQINDLLLAAPYLYAAGAGGVTQIDVQVPTLPFVTARLTTTSGSAFSLAIKGDNLYAADGDASIEVYSIRIPSLPQKIGAFPSLPRSSSVSVNADRIYVSDGLQTDVLTGTDTSVVRLGGLTGVATTALVPLTLSIAWTGGGRSVRVIDFRDPSAPQILWSQQVPLSAGGTINRISAMTQGDDGRLYVAAGDGGLVTIDPSQFLAPFPLRDRVEQGTTSIFSFGNTVAAATVGGGMEQFSQSTDGVLAPVSHWAADRTWSVHDGRQMRLLASSAGLVALWDLVPAPPALISGGSLRAPVSSAVLTSPSVAVAVLTDHSVWRIDFSTEPASVASVATTGSPSFVVRSDPALATAQVNDDGSTTIRYFAEGDLTGIPALATLDGAATNGIALSPTHLVAAATFRGLVVANFVANPPVVSVLSSLNPQPAKGLAFAGSSLLALRTSALEVWDLASGSLRASFALPSTAARLSVPASPSVASVATDEGVASVLYDSSSRLPGVTALALANRYYRHLSGDAARIALFDGRNATLLPTGKGGAVLGTSSVAMAGNPVDVAVSGNAIYAVDSSGIVSQLDNSGRTLSSLDLAEGADSTPLAIFAIDGAIYVSISRGCLSTGCEKKTVVIDSRSGVLVKSAELTGGLVDFAEGGGRAYMLVDLPGEVRIVDLSDPFHPVVTAAAASAGNPVSIAYSAPLSTLFTLGTTLDTFSVPSLSHATSSQLPSYIPDPSGRVSYPDQRLRIDGQCALVVGRAFSPQLFHIDGGGNWIPAAAPTVPAAGKGVFASPGVFQILTDYSLETWSILPAGRHRPVR